MKKKNTDLMPFEFIPCVSPNTLCGLRLPDGGEILIGYERNNEKTKDGEQLGILRIISQTTDFDSLKILPCQSRNCVEISVGFVFD